MEILKEGNISNNVLVGKEGYLFLYDGGQEQFSFLLGNKKPTQTSITNFIQNIRNRAFLLESRGILFNHIVFPSKPIINHSYLPNEFKRIKSIYESHYKPNAEDIFENLIYPNNSLIKLEDNGMSTFRKLDTHNTDKAKETLANLLLNKLGINEPFEYPYTTRHMQGDLSNLLGLPSSSPEYIANLCPGPYKVVGNRAHLPGNTNEVLISTYLYNSTKKRVLIFGDSFYKDLIPFLQPYFSDLMYVRSQHIHMDIIDAYSPDIVLTGNAERYLSNVRSDNFSQNVILELYGDKDYQPDKDYLDAFKAQLSYAYYKHLYVNYKRKLQSLYKTSGTLKIASWNSQLIPIEKETLLFESVGNDPIFYFEDIYFDSSTIHEIDISMHSNTNSSLQLFFTTLFDCNFSEKKSIRKKITCGENNIKIKIKTLSLGRKLRLDPLNSAGVIKINNISISSTTTS